MATFDIDRFIRLSGAVDVSDLDLKEAARIGLSSSEATILRYMADTETHTILYLRDLLAGHTCYDDEVTQFLSVWVYEELWHGRALDLLLDTCGYPKPPQHFSQTAQKVSWREPIEAAASHMAAWATPKFAATHMSWGAINELTAAAAYKALAARSKNPVLKQLLGRLVKQERKHFSFYYHQAQRRLENDKWAQRICRTVLKAAWTPVGSGVGGKETMGFIADTLFTDAEGLAMLRDIDATTQKLPGLSWFDLVSTRVARVASQYRDDKRVQQVKGAAAHSATAERSAA